MDEPTAALTHAEADRLFAVIADLKARGAAILYVSHRMAEVVEIADRVTVLRDGAVALSCPMAETSKDGIIAAMTGQAWPTPIRSGPAGTAPGREVVLEVAGLSVGPVRDVISPSGGARSSASRGWKAPGSRRSCARFWAICGPGGRIRLGGEPAPRSAAEGWAAASPMSRASGGARG
jgi:hypothetical protein